MLANFLELLSVFLLGWMGLAFFSLLTLTFVLWRSVLKLPLPFVFVAVLVFAVLDSVLTWMAFQQLEGVEELGMANILFPRFGLVGGLVIHGVLTVAITTALFAGLRKHTLAGFFQKNTPTPFGSLTASGAVLIFTMMVPLRLLVLIHSLSLLM